MCSRIPEKADQAASVVLDPKLGPLSLLELHSEVPRAQWTVGGVGDAALLIDTPTVMLQVAARVPSEPFAVPEVVARDCKSRRIDVTCLSSALANLDGRIRVELTPMLEDESVEREGLDFFVFHYRRQSILSEPGSSTGRRRRT
jgi:hypothetical protein